MLLEISKSLLLVALRADFGNECWVLVSSASFYPWDVVPVFCTLFLLHYLVKEITRSGYCCWFPLCAKVVNAILILA